MVKPNLIIAGVNKAGTTSVFSYLVRHPDVCGSNVKETCYFLPVRYGKEVSDFAEYQAMFPTDTPCKIVMEGTPGYFYGGTDLIQQIDDTLPDVKIVILLRDPASRLISFYLFMKSMLFIDQNMTLEGYITHCKSFDRDELKLQRNNSYFGVEGGYYYKYLDGWAECFGDRLKLIFFEDVKNNPITTLKDLSLWLEIDQDFYDGHEFSVENKTMMPKNKGVQKLAISVNKRAEVLFRKLPFLKRSLKGIYSLLNHSEKESFSNIDRVMVEKLYEESNQVLLHKLKAYGLTDFPSWLKG